MNEQDKKAFAKHMGLTVAGVALQMAGALCLVAAAVGVLKEVNIRVKQAIVRELSK